jgi:hypothetical protein
MPVTCWKSLLQYVIWRLDDVAMLIGYVRISQRSTNAELLERARRGSFGSEAPSMRSRSKVDTVLDYNYRGSETAKWERTLW